MYKNSILVAKTAWWSFKTRKIALREKILMFDITSKLTLLSLHRIFLRFIVVFLFYSEFILNFAAEIKKEKIMEAKTTTAEHRTPEEIRAWFKRRKAWYQEVEEQAHAMYEEEEALIRSHKILLFSLPIK